MRRTDHPDGKRLPALEENILKYRALQMVLFLFYAEDFREFVLAIAKNEERSGITDETKNKLEKALKFFAKEELITADEKADIESLINYRNDIAHRIQMLVGDINRDSFIRDFYKISKETPRYDYTVIKRIRKLHREFFERAENRYVITISFDSLLFTPAEKTFEKELKRLGRKIDLQMQKRKISNGKLDVELSLEGTGLTGWLAPSFPYNFYQSGKLTPRGIEICYRLYDFGKSPLAVAHLMKISKKAATYRKKLWQQAGGLNRTKSEIKAGR